MAVGKSIKKINRLVLIGNGFDLAHKLKTSYNDFILWYLSNSIWKSAIHRDYEDELVMVQRLDFYAFEQLSQHGICNEKDYVRYFYSKGFAEMLNGNSIKIEGWQPNYKNPFNIAVKSSLLLKLLNDCSDFNWVDIENIFYDQLKHILHHVENGNRAAAVRELNDDLKSIVGYLEIYLNTLEKTKLQPGYNRILGNPFDPREFLGLTMIEQNEFCIDQTMILNFNYTSTIESYVNQENIRNYQINYIHGRLNDLENKVIFGFGDELDKDYLNFELDKTVGIFEYIKSFWYFKTTNYHDLIRFIDSSPFQVYVLGHSCGLSDRTMLNMIFEHENCRSIKIYYYQNGDFNNYTILTQEIARHFRDKQDMRRKIVPFSLSTPMPQLENED